MRQKPLKTRKKGHFCIFVNTEVYNFSIVYIHLYGLIYIFTGYRHLGDPPTLGETTPKPLTILYGAIFLVQPRQPHPFFADYIIWCDPPASGETEQAQDIIIIIYTYIFVSYY